MTVSHNLKATPSSSESSASESQADSYQKTLRVEAEQLKVLYARTSAGFAANIFNAGLIIAFYRERLPKMRRDQVASYR